MSSTDLKDQVDVHSRVMFLLIIRGTHPVMMNAFDVAAMKRLV
jgi:hypothetical protein